MYLYIIYIYILYIIYIIFFFFKIFRERKFLIYKMHSLCYDIIVIHCCLNYYILKAYILLIYNYRNFIIFLKF